MKHFTSFLILLLSAVSCLTLEDSLSLGTARGSRSVPRMADSTSTADDPPPVIDTVLWFTAVRFASGYDWRQDSAYYSQNGEIQLYKDFNLVSSAEISRGNHVGAGADMHHIIGGRLITEYADAVRTYIGIDGEELLRYEGPEQLCGFLMADGHAYTLGKMREGGGLVLRKDGQTLFSNEDGVAIGSLTDQIFSESGALYLDGDEICFAFSEGGRAHLVSDGRDSIVCETGDRYHDIRKHDGVTYYISRTAGRTFLVAGGDVTDISEDGSVDWDDARLVFTGRGCAVAGKAKDPISWGYVSAIWQNLRTNWLRTGTEESFIYYDGMSFLVLGHGSDGRVTIPDKVGAGSFPEGKFYFFHPGCACFCEAGSYMTLTPMDRDSYPLIWYNGRCQTLKINGFLTGIRAVSVLPGDKS